MVKKSKLWIIFVIVGVLFFFLFYTNNLPFILGQPKSCDQTPNDYRCFCGAGYLKNPIVNEKWQTSFTCEKMPDLPAEVTFPIETWEEATKYAENTIGGFKCEGNYYYNSPISGEIEKECNQYGSVATTFPNIYMGHNVILECLQMETIDELGRPSSGNVVWSLKFDPNDGWISRYVFAENIFNSPIAEIRSNPRPDLQPPCGDGCCHYSENSDNCPSDCPVLKQPSCTNEDIIKWIDTQGNGFFSSLCSKAGGISKITGASFYPTCDYYQYMCLLNDKEILRWDTNSGINQWNYNSFNCGQKGLLGADYNIICPIIQ